MARIAFIGLGHMGGGMAPNLVKAGHEVRAFDLSEEALAAAVEKGCVSAASADEAVADAEVVITMLPAAQHVLDVHRNHVLGKAPTSALLIDCSTIDVASARTIEEEAVAQGYTMVDAPVSGGIAAAAGGSLRWRAATPTSVSGGHAISSRATSSAAVAVPPGTRCQHCSSV